MFVNTNLSIVFRTLLIRYAIVTKILKLISLPSSLSRLFTRRDDLLSDFNDDLLTEIFLYGKEDFKNVNDTSILDVTINYLIETKIFDAQLF